MKTELKTESYWDCRYSDHRHQTQVAAQECIDKKCSSGGGKNGRLPDISRLQAFADYWTGVPISQIADRFGVSVQKIKQEIKKAETMSQEIVEGNPFAGLPINIVATLKNAGINTVEEVYKGLDSGRVGAIKGFGQTKKNTLKIWLKRTQEESADQP